MRKCLVISLSIISSICWAEDTVGIVGEITFGDGIINGRRAPNLVVSHLMVPSSKMPYQKWEEMAESDNNDPTPRAIGAGPTHVSVRIPVTVTFLTPRYESYLKLKTRWAKETLVSARAALGWTQPDSGTYPGPYSTYAVGNTAIAHARLGSRAPLDSQTIGTATEPGQNGRNDYKPASPSLDYSGFLNVTTNLARTNGGLEYSGYVWITMSKLEAFGTTTHVDLMVAPNNNSQASFRIEEYFIKTGSCRVTT